MTWQNKDNRSTLDFSELDAKDKELQALLDAELKGMQFLLEESNKIGNPESLGEVVRDVIWSQFKKHLSVTTGIELDEESYDLTSGFGEKSKKDIVLENLGVTDRLEGKRESINSNSKEQRQQVHFECHGDSTLNVSEIKSKEKANTLDGNLQDEETFRATGNALRRALMDLLASLVKKIINSLVKWLRSANKKWDELVDNIKDAIQDFVANLRTHIIDIETNVVMTIVTTIWGPIARILFNIWSILKQGWKALLEAVRYIKDPVNKSKPFNVLILEVGKILIAALSGMGAVTLGQNIEFVLATTIPIMAIEIPLLGSLASILGMFFGTVISGVIGAIAINRIEEMVAEKLSSDNLQKRVNVGSSILNLQEGIIAIGGIKVDRNIERIVTDIHDSNQLITDKLRECSEQRNKVNNSERQEALQYLKESLDN